MAIRGQDRFNRRIEGLRGSGFDHERFAGKDGQYALDAFWRFDEPAAEGDLDVPRRIRTFWMSDNEMSDGRRQCLRELQQQPVDVDLVTADQLSRIVLEEYPLHPAFADLSAVHRSDYLRAYCMHHHGGGYSDVKAPTADWTAGFDLLQADRSAWMVGYQEPSSVDCARIESGLGRELRRRSGLLAGNCAFIFRPRTTLTAEWLAEVERRLDYFAPLLRRAPARDPFGDTPDYPVPWTMLQAQVLQPLQLKYLDRIRLDPAVRPRLYGHR